jgi:hypothetical protein
MKEEFYKKLKQTLENEEKWPLDYMFKFICPNKQLSISKIEDVFENDNADSRKNISKNGKYVALTFIAKMQNSNTIIDRYRSLEDVEDLLML